jgi:hypothetical protein
VVKLRVVKPPQYMDNAQVVYPPVQDGLPTCAGWFTHFWEVVYLLLGGGLPTSGRWFTHFWEVVYPPVPNGLPTSGRWLTYFWRVVKPLLKRLSISLMQLKPH